MNSIKLARLMKKLRWIGLAIGVVIILVLLQRSCNIYDNYSKLKGEYDTLRAINTQNKLRAEQIITTQSDYINQLEGAIKNAFGIITSKNQELRSLDNELQQIEAIYPTIQTSIAKIVNLESQLSIWKEKFTVASEIIAQQESAIFSLVKKYEAQLIISNEYKGLYEREEQLRKLADERLNLADRKISSLQLGTQVRNLVALSLAGVILINIVK